MKLGLRIWEGNEDEFRRWGTFDVDTVRIGRAAGWSWTHQNGLQELDRVLDINWFASERIAMVQVGVQGSEHDKRLALTSDADFIPRFVNYMMGLHDAAKGRVTHWEILNEPGLGNANFPQSIIDLAAFNAWIIELTAACRVALPDAQLIGPAWSMVPYGGESRDLVAGGYLDLVDGYSFHDYNPGSGSPRVVHDPNHPSVSKRYDILTSMLNGKEIFITEWGADYRTATPETVRQFAVLYHKHNIHSVIMHNAAGTNSGTGGVGTWWDGFTPDLEPTPLLLAFIEAINAAPEINCQYSEQLNRIEQAVTMSVPSVMIGVTQAELDAVPHTRHDAIAEIVRLHKGKMITE